MYQHAPRSIPFRSGSDPRAAARRIEPVRAGRAKPGVGAGGGAVVGRADRWWFGVVVWWQHCIAHYCTLCYCALCYCALCYCALCYCALCYCTLCYCTLLSLSLRAWSVLVDSRPCIPVPAPPPGPRAGPPPKVCARRGHHEMTPRVNGTALHRTVCDGHVLFHTVFHGPSRSAAGDDKSAAGVRGDPPPSPSCGCRSRRVRRKAAPRCQSVPSRAFFFSGLHPPPPPSNVVFFSPRQP